MVRCTGAGRLRKIGWDRYYLVRLREVRSGGDVKPVFQIALGTTRCTFV